MEKKRLRVGDVVGTYKCLECKARAIITPPIIGGVKLSETSQLNIVHVEHSESCIVRVYKSRFMPV